MRGVGVDFVGVVVPLAGGVLLLLGVALSSGSPEGAFLSAEAPSPVSVPDVGSEDSDGFTGIADADCRDEIDTDEETTRWPLQAEHDVKVRRRERELSVT